MDRCLKDREQRGYDKNPHARVLHCLNDTYDATGLGSLREKQEDRLFWDPIRQKRDKAYLQPATR